MGTLFSEWEPRASEKRYFHQDAISIRATMEDRVREGKPQRGAEGELGGGVRRRAGAARWEKTLGKFTEKQ